MSQKSAKTFFTFGAITVAIFVGYVFASAPSKDSQQNANSAQQAEVQTIVEANQASAGTVTAAEQQTQTASRPSPLAAPATNFIEGKHYITKFPNSNRAKEPVLVEFFSYMCPHCYRLEGTVKKWQKQKPDNVKLIKIPVAFAGNKLYEIASRAHYIAEELNIVDTFGDAMFKRIHIDKRPPRNDNDLAKLFAELGISQEDFKKASVNNFNVESKIRKANFLSRQYQVNGVPYLLINYKYEIGQDSYKSEQTLFDLWNNFPEQDFK